MRYLYFFAWAALVWLLAYADSQAQPAPKYDAIGQFIRTRDEQGRILAQQQYHYAQS